MKINKFLISIFSILLIYTIIGFIAIPKIAKPQIEKIINENITQTATIQRIKFNPFLLNFSIDNLKIANDNQEVTFSLKNVTLDFSLLKSIDKKHINFKILKIVEPYINIVENPDGSFNLEKLVKTSPKEEEKIVEKSSEEQSDIKFQIMKTVIANAKIDFTKIIPNQKPYKATIHNFNYTFYDMGTFKNSLASHTLQMDINKNTNLSIKGGLRLTPFEMYGNINIKDLKPKEFLDYDTDILNFKIDQNSFIDLTLGYKIDMKDQLNVQIDHANLALNNLKVLNDNQKLIDLKSLNINDLNLKYPQNKIDIKSIILDKINSNIKSDKNGVLNFENLIKNKEEDTKEQQTDQTPWKIAINNFKINDSSINYDDIKNNLKLISTDLNLNIDNFKLIDQDISFKNLALNKSNLNFRQKQREIGIKELSFNSEDFDFKQENINLKNATVLINTIELNEYADKLNIKTKNLKVKSTTNSYKDGIVNVNKLLLSNSLVDLIDNKNSMNIKVEDINLDINKITQNLDQIRVDSLVLKNSLTNIVDKKNNQNFKAKNIDLNVKNIDQKADKLTIAKSSINKPEISISLGKNTNVSKDEETKNIKKGETETNEKGSSFKFDLGPLQINQMKMSFEDKNLPIPFKTNITQLNGQISRLNSTTSEPTKLKLEGKVDKYGYTKITGRVDINDIKLLTDTNLLFKNIAIKNFTPYSGKFIGRAIDSGKLNLDLNYNIKKSNLDAQNSIVISDIKLGKNIESKDAISLPLELAIALLEDSDGVINIDLPVKGNVDDPEFSIAPIVWKAFTNLIIKAVSSPFTLLGSLFNIDEEKLKAIEFEYGQSTILASEKESLDAIAKILKQKDKLAIKLFPIYDSINDRFALQKIKFEKVLQQHMKDYNGEDKYAKALEDLYEDAKFDKSLDDIKTDFVTKNKNGEEIFDTKSYLDYIKNTLAKKEIIKDEQLISLVNQRVKNIKAYLQSKDLPKGSFLIEDIKEHTSDDKKWIKLKLEVSSK